MAMDLNTLLNATAECLLFSALGLVAFVIAIFLVQWLLPFSLRKEMEEDQNVAVGIVLGAMILGIAHIIATAIAGG